MILWIAVGVVVSNPPNDSKWTSCLVTIHVTYIESLINTRTLKKRCALAARTEVKQTQEL